MSGEPQHKRTYRQFIDPNYAESDKVDIIAITARFQKFHDDLLDDVPNTGEPSEGYPYSSHMGALARKLDSCKDHYVKGLLAFHHKKRPKTS